MEETPRGATEEGSQTSTDFVHALSSTICRSVHVNNIHSFKYFQYCCYTQSGKRLGVAAVIQIKTNESVSVETCNAVTQSVLFSALKSFWRIHQLHPIIYIQIHAASREKEIFSETGNILSFFSSADICAANVK